MTEQVDHSGKRNIPLLDDNNFAAWSTRIKAYLRSRKLLKYIKQDALSGLEGVARSNAANKQAEAVDILMEYLSPTAFDTIITPDNNSDSYLIYQKILWRFALTSVVNKGRVWLKFMRYKYSGDLKRYITDVTHLLNEIAVVKLGVLVDVLCFSILSKISGDMYNHVNNIIYSPYCISHPDATLSKLQELVYLDESRKNKLPAQIPTDNSPEAATALMKEAKFKRKLDQTKPVNFCSPGNHNPLAAHDEKNCWNLHPKLRPGYKPSQSTQLVEFEETTPATILLTEGQPISKPTVIDSGATHHMVNDPSKFITQKTIYSSISTGSLKNSLTATAVGSANLVDPAGNC